MRPERCVKEGSGSRQLTLGALLGDLEWGSFTGDFETAGGLWEHVYIWAHTEGTWRGAPFMGDPEGNVGEGYGNGHHCP